jgi:hypothetical protein
MRSSSRPARPRAPRLRLSRRSSPAHAAALVHAPAITAHALEDVERILGIVLALDIIELLEVRAVENVLPALLAEISFVHVGPGAGRDGLDLGHEFGRHLLLRGFHVGPGGRRVPVGDELELRDGVAPGGQDGVVGHVGALRVVGGRAREQDAAGDELVVDLDELGVVVDGDGARDQAAAELVAVDFEGAAGERAHVAVVVVAVGEGAVGDGRGDAEVDEGLGEGRQNDVLDVGCVGVPDGDGLEDEVLLVLEEDDHGAGIDHGGHELVELGDGGSELLGGGGRCEELHGCSADGFGIVGADGQGDDDSVGSAATTAEGPVQVSVLGGRGSNEVTVGSDDVKGESLISCKTKGCAKSRVTSTLSEATCKTDSGTFTRNDSQALGISSLEDLITNGTGTDRGTGSGVVLVRPGAKVDVLETLGPNGQGTGTGGATEEIMARVANDNTDVVVLCKLERTGDILGLGGLDRVGNVVAELAGNTPVGKGVTALVGKVRLHDRVRGWSAGIMISC